MSKAAGLPNIQSGTTTSAGRVRHFSCPRPLPARLQKYVLKPVVTRGHITPVFTCLMHDDSRVRTQWTVGTLEGINTLISISSVPCKSTTSGDCVL